MTEKQYDLYFSKIIYRDYFHPGDLVWKACELHGDSLSDNELIEVKWNNGIIEQFKIKIKTEIISFKSKKDVPYGIITNCYWFCFYSEKIERIQTRTF